MTVQNVPNTKYAKGVRWLAELYKNRQVDSVTAQTLNKLVDLEASRLRLQLEDMERVIADYEKQHGMSSAEFLRKYEAGKTDDRMDYVEWASLTKMSRSFRKTLAAIVSEG
ncbi:MAG: hypothetical protein RBS68_06230 [Anaerolineales bacterium]|jgi:hypothetical protein|nr:hypothetical protein [Anaerolineales bacterium]